MRARRLCRTARGSAAQGHSAPHGALRAHGGVDVAQLQQELSSARAEADALREEVARERSEREATEVALAELEEALAAAQGAAAAAASAAVHSAEVVRRARPDCDGAPRKAYGARGGGAERGPFYCYPEEIDGLS